MCRTKRGIQNRQHGCQVAQHRGPDRERGRQVHGRPRGQHRHQGDPGGEGQGDGETSCGLQPREDASGAGRVQVQPHGAEDVSVSQGTQIYCWFSSLQTLSLLLLIHSFYYNQLLILSLIMSKISLFAISLSDRVFILSMQLISTRFLFNYSNYFLLSSFGFLPHSSFILTLLSVC